MTAESQAPELQPDDFDPDLGEDQSPSWVSIILDLPRVGGFLCFALAAIPFFLVALVSTIFADLFGYTSGSESEFFYISVIGWPITYVWLLFLERRAGVALCLPLPIVNIKIRWVMIALAPFLVAEYLGLM